MHKYVFLLLAVSDKTLHLILSAGFGFRPRPGESTASFKGTVHNIPRIWTSLCGYVHVTLAHYEFGSGPTKTQPPPLLSPLLHFSASGSPLSLLCLSQCRHTWKVRQSTGVGRNNAAVEANLWRHEPTTRNVSMTCTNRNYLYLIRFVNFISVLWLFSWPFFIHHRVFDVYVALIKKMKVQFRDVG